LSEISIPRRVSGGAHLHLYRPGIIDALILAAYSLARFFSTSAHVHCFSPIPREPKSPSGMIASPLPHPATPLLTGLADLSFKLASSGRPCGQAHIASRTRACRYAAGVTVVTPSASSPLSSVTSSSLCSCHGSTRTDLPHAPSGLRPRLGTCPVMVQRSRSESVVTLPCSRLAVMSPHYRTSPGSRSHFLLTPPLVMFTLPNESPYSIRT
jgi:hypothetical protein